MQVIPGRGSGVLNVSFTPLAESDVAQLVSCVSYALGYVSLEASDRYVEGNVDTTPEAHVEALPGDAERAADDVEAPARHDVEGIVEGTAREVEGTAEETSAGHVEALPRDVTATAQHVDGRIRRKQHYDVPPLRLDMTAQVKPAL